jgi:small subunit ribosomal protein S16
MAVKLRLQRHGKKGKPFFHIVAADSRSPRDGKFIERIGSYNPNTNPATIQLDNAKAIEWLNNGAQPTDTVRAMLSYTGVLLRQHLNKGVAKGAFSQEEADKRFENWITDKTGKIQSKKDRIAKEKSDSQSKALKHEREVNENRLKAMTAAAEAASASSAETASEEAPAADAPAENSEA